MKKTAKNDWEKELFFSKKNSSFARKIPSPPYLLYIGIVIGIGRYEKYHIGILSVSYTHLTLPTILLV